MGFLDFLEDFESGLGKVGDIVKTGNEIVGSIKGGGSGGTSAPNYFIPPGFSPSGGAPTIPNGSGLKPMTLLLLGAITVGIFFLARKS